MATLSLAEHYVKNLRLGTIFLHVLSVITVTLATPLFDVFYYVIISFHALLLIGYGLKQFYQ